MSLRQLFNTSNFNIGSFESYFEINKFDEAINQHEKRISAMRDQICILEQRITRLKRVQQKGKFICPHDYDKHVHSRNEKKTQIK